MEKLRFGRTIETLRNTSFLVSQIKQIRITRIDVATKSAEFGIQFNPKSCNVFVQSSSGFTPRELTESVLRPAMLQSVRNITYFHIQKGLFGSFSHQEKERKTCD